MNFSIIVPIYNKKPHLERSIYSVLNQSYSGWELILIDDGSTDGSLEYLEGLDDDRITLIKRSIPGPGGYAARNVGLKTARYDWIAFLDADDEWHLDKLQHVSSAILGNPNCDFVSSGWIEKRHHKEEIDAYFIRNSYKGIHSFDLNHFVTNPQLVCTDVAVIRRNILLSLDGFDTNWKMGADLDLWVRVLMTGAKGIWIDQVLATYFLNSVNMVTRDTIFFNSSVISTIKSYLDQEISILRSVRVNLKKYSNRIVWYTVRRRLRKNNRYKSMILRDFYFSPFLISKIYCVVILFILIPYPFASYLLNRRII